MDYKINKNCIGCGRCESICPELFELNDKHFPEISDDEDELKVSYIINDAAEYAKLHCPFNAIQYIENDMSFE